MHKAGLAEIQEAVRKPGENATLSLHGSLVVPDLCSVNLDPKRWETPHQFNPDHFLDKDGKFNSRDDFFPYGAGDRVCPGEQLAKIELFVFLTSLLRVFSFRLPKGVKKSTLQILENSYHVSSQSSLLQAKHS
uniref:Cytochrome P450 n=1 Tax=Salvator merianae TaxID=96440 RepID=A0A8D0AXY2_SALMN